MSDTIFTGFPPTTIDFLENLAENNNREWFADNRSAYENDLLAPAVAFVEAVGEALRARFPEIGYDTRTNGSGSLMRIYRDTRFSQDKTPYKTNISGMFWEGDGRKTEAPAFGFQLTPEGMGLMAGMFGFSKPQLAAYRAAVLDEDLGPRLEEAAAGVLAAGPYELAGKEYKRVPRGFDADHPRAEWLLYKGLWVHTRRPLKKEQVEAPDLEAQVVDHFEKMAPIQRWLSSALSR